MIIPEILWRDPAYIGCNWRHHGEPDDYTTLAWSDDNTTAKPTEQDLVSAWPTIKQEIILEVVRRERDVLLAATDWWAVADRTMTAEQTAYRQALRDITNDLAGVDYVRAADGAYYELTGVTWPTKPE